MSARAQELARQFEQANAEFITFISGMTEDEWLTECPNEKRTMAALARHVAGGYAFEQRAFEGIVANNPLPTLMWAELDEMNATYGAKFAQGDRAETIHGLMKNAAITAEWVRGLSDADLQAAGEYLEGLPSMTIDRWVEFILIGHIRMHRESMEAVLNRPAASTA